MIVLVIIVMYIIIGIGLDMFNVYYCIKYLSKKDSLNIFFIIFWPGACIYSIAKYIKKLSNKYTDLMVEAYGDEKLIEDIKSKKKDEWTITTTDFENKEDATIRVVIVIDCHKINPDTLYEISNICNNPDQYKIELRDSHSYSYAEVKSFKILYTNENVEYLTLSVTFELVVDKIECSQLHSDRIRISFEPLDKGHHITYTCNCIVVLGKELFRSNRFMHPPIKLQE